MEELEQKESRYLDRVIFWTEIVLEVPSAAAIGRVQACSAAAAGLGDAALDIGGTGAVVRHVVALGRAVGCVFAFTGLALLGIVLARDSCSVEHWMTGDVHLCHSLGRCILVWERASKLLSTWWPRGPGEGKRNAW